MLGWVGLKIPESRDVCCYVVTHRRLLSATTATAPPAQTSEVAAQMCDQQPQNPNADGGHSRRVSHPPHCVLISRAGKGNEEFEGSEAQVGDQPPRWTRVGDETPRKAGRG